ncbi:hypothetical protein [Streptomyces sp. NPDC058254]|uniref:hypothetical protein n=1 Tax=Streptomyces sp. NPDC058254 TaxID=3346406 RepID=UPI0036EC1D66
MITEADMRAVRADGDLPAFFHGLVQQAHADNARRRALVNRYPDLADRIRQLPGHARWSGSVGENPHTAAIVAEAETRAGAAA